MDLHTLSPEQVEAVKAMRKCNMSWKKIGATLGVNPATARRAVDRVFRVALAERIARNKTYGSVGIPPITGAQCAERRTVAQDARILMARIPDDTRNLTARIFGDPLPGRSALDAMLTTNKERERV